MRSWVSGTGLRLDFLEIWFRVLLMAVSRLISDHMLGLPEMLHPYGFDIDFVLVISGSLDQM